jgi:hypothetical protein
LPGAAEALAPRLASAFGSDPERWQSALQIATLSGIAPVRRASGMKSGKKGQRKASVHFRQACRSSYASPFTNLPAVPSATALGLMPTTMPCALGVKAIIAALRSVAFKWIRILFACWKQRSPYDPQRYLQALQRRGSPLANPC